MNWTDELKKACEGRCGDMGDPPCYRLPDLTSDAPRDIGPCLECQGWKPIETARTKQSIIGRTPGGFEAKMWWEDCAWVSADFIGMASYPTHWKPDPDDKAPPRGPYSPPHHLLVEMDKVFCRDGGIVGVGNRWNVNFEDGKPFLTEKEPG